MKAIEVSFPFEQIDSIAELESWRKEVTRPIYYIHKWWAKRLGSVFRAMIIGAFLDDNEDIWNNFYKEHSFENKIVLDPFMGSGTTLGECAKLGIKPIGCDINPISSFIVKQSLTEVDIQELEKTYNAIKNDVQEKIQRYYKTLDPDTNEIYDVLYYFWVKEVITPDGVKIPLFPSYIFSKNAYPKKKPEAQIICPKCWKINIGKYNDTNITCKSCGYCFNPQIGQANREKVIDNFGREYKIKNLLSATSTPPQHRLYALMALNNKGEKIYLAPTQFDFQLYKEASAELPFCDMPLPDIEIRSGHNTDQARGYNYFKWKDFFNDRQLLCLGILFKRIIAIENKELREQFLCLFSSTLEFNNLFCSFKGEGTGAVRHLFSNHILKPEKMPIENNIWGTSKSSGTFSTLFRSRLLKAKEYLKQPFEIEKLHEKTHNSTTKRVCSSPIRLSVTDNYDIFSQSPKAALILNGDSSNLPIPDEIVDAIITDPPYFDFIHYSELSDFFFSWLSIALKDDYQWFNKSTSGDKNEVQHKCPKKFAQSLGRVLKESFRILKTQGLLIFSFHHSNPLAWVSIYQSIIESGFSIVASHPIKAEMAVGTPKTASKSPINIDAIIVCKKMSEEKSHDENQVWNETNKRFIYYCDRFQKIGRNLSTNDKHVIMASQLLVYASLSKMCITTVEPLMNKVFNGC